MATPTFNEKEFAEGTMDGINGLVAKVLPGVVSNGIAAMRIRIQSGEGLNGKTMRPYSKGYKKQREKLSRQSARRDLSVTGKMLGGIHLQSIKPSANGVTADIGIVGARNRELALYHQKKTPWFGFTDEELAEMTAELKSKIEAS